MADRARSFLAPRAWVGSGAQAGWADNVMLSCGPDGLWSEIAVNVTAAVATAAGAQRLAGPVLPGLVNAHSHAFQRAIAGLTERSSAGEDDFWRWRDRMYSVANRITPLQLEAIAAHLYGELLCSGYTHVCEFHYLHNDEAGRPYADPAEMALALVRAARLVGIGLTLLPTLYMRAGFGAAGLRDDQLRFASTPDTVLRISEAVQLQAQAAGLGGVVRSGVALHSLRAVGEDALKEIAHAARGRLPVHIHIAEQHQEVTEGLAQLGRRPIEWLLDNLPIDASWNLVHATQATRSELAAIHAAGAAIVICPSTEANLGDGVFDLPAWLVQGGAWSIGSDSHVTRSAAEELRLLEYSQRLTLRQRNVAARAAGCDSSAAALFQGALQGGSAAAGLPLGGLAIGQRADFLVIDPDAAPLLGVPPDALLDALVFSSGEGAGRAVYSVVHVAGRPLMRADTAPAFVQAMRGLGTH